MSSSIITHSAVDKLSDIVCNPFLLIRSKESDTVPYSASSSYKALSCEDREILSQKIEEFIISNQNALLSANQDEKVFANLKALKKICTELANEEIDAPKRAIERIAQLKLMIKTRKENKNQLSDQAATLSIRVCIEQLLGNIAETSKSIQECITLLNRLTLQENQDTIFKTIMHQKISIQVFVKQDLFAMQSKDVLTQLFSKAVDSSKEWSKLCRVNKHFYQMLHDPMITAEILKKPFAAKGKEDIEFICKFNDPQKIHNLELDFSLCKDISDEDLNKLAQKCPNLTKILLPSCRNITDDGIIALSKSCHELKEIQFAITEKALEALASGCPKLEMLKIMFSPVVEKLDFSGIFEMKNLKELILPPIYSTLAKLVNEDKKLSLLEVIDFSINFNPKKNLIVDDEEVEAIVKVAPQIKRIILDNTSVTNQSLHLLANVNHLTMLSIKGCKKIIFNGSDQDQDLTNLIKVLQANPNLEHLAFDKKHTVDDESDLIKILESCHQLKSIHFPTVESRLGFRAMEALASHSRTLKALLVRIDKRDDEIFMNSLFEQPFPVLEEIEIEDNGYCIDEIDVADLAKQAPCLKFFKANFTVGGIKALVDCCKNLEIIDLSSTKEELNDDVLLYLIKAFPKLTSLVLPLNEKWTDNFLKAIPQYCPRLENLSLTNVSKKPLQITYSALTLLCASLPYLKQTHFKGFGLDNRSLKKLASCAKQLHTLSFKWDRSFSAIDPSFFRQMRHLKFLNIDKDEKDFKNREADLLGELVKQMMLDCPSITVSYEQQYTFVYGGLPYVN